MESTSRSWQIVVSTHALIHWVSYVPYKYALEKFITAGSITKDHTDPSIFCILTAKSKIPGIPLADFCVLGPRWDVATQTFRPPVSRASSLMYHGLIICQYFHRNCATELVGFIKGDISSRAGSWKAGGLSYHTNFCPHGGMLYLSSGESLSHNIFQWPPLSTREALNKNSHLYGLEKGCSVSLVFHALILRMLSWNLISISGRNCIDIDDHRLCL